MLPPNPENSEIDLILQSGRLPASKVIPLVTAEERISPPPGLSRPIAVVGAVADIEIAPSRTDQYAPGQYALEQYTPDQYAPGAGHNADQDVGRELNHLVDEDAQRRGLIIHRILELLTTPALSPEQALSRVANKFSADQEQSELQQCWREALAVVHNPAFRTLFDPNYYSAAYNEVPIQYCTDAQRIYGIIDRLVVDRDHVLLVDYKTHRGATLETLHQYAQPYYAQINLYAQGVQKLWPDKTLKTALLFTACNALYEMG